MVVMRDVLWMRFAPNTATPCRRNVEKKSKQLWLARRSRASQSSDRITHHVPPRIQVHQIVLLLALLAAPTYRFPVGRPVTYQANMQFDGFLPILGIGLGKAEVKGTFEVAGKSEASASVKLTAFTVTFNGEKVPIDLDDAQKYVPGGTFTYAPSGHVDAWDAPKVAAPIRVPGLDLAHLPSVLFLPIEFPDGGVKGGDSFKFSLPLSGGTAD